MRWTGINSIHSVESRRQAPMKSTRTASALFTFLLLATLVKPAAAQGARDWVDISYSTAAQGVDTVALIADITIRDDWKMYAVGNGFPPVSLELNVDPLPDGVAIAGAIGQSSPKQAFDKNFNKEVYYFQHEGRIWMPLVLASGAAPSDSIRGDVRYQICSDSRGLCLPPTRDKFALAVKDAADCLDAEASECSAAPLDVSLLGASSPGNENQTTASAKTVQRFDLPDDMTGARSAAGLGFILLAIGAGFGALLTPCVFPMVPLTVSFFTKHGENRSQAVRMALIYGTSIVVTFTVLGVVMASIYGAAGVQTIASSPWVNLFFAAVLIFFALSLLGLFELTLPSSFVNYFNRQSNEKSGWLGVVFMGLTLTLVSFSCTAPFVGGLLAAAASGSWLRPVVGMAAFSSAFALPFVLLALFPKALKSLPKSGSWMNAMKVTLGFVELAAAIKFLSNADLVFGWGLISRPLAISVTVVIFFLTGMYLIGKLRLKHEEIEATVGVPRLMAAIAFFGLGLYLIPGLFGAPLNSLDAFLPPRQATDLRLAAVGSELQGGLDDGWIVDNIDEAYSVASSRGMPILVDFTGYTCTNCRQMESTVFPVPKVADRLERDFVRLRLYTDGQELGDDFQRYQLKLTGTVALPTYAILSPDGSTLIAKTSGLQSADKFAAFLETGRDNALMADNVAN